MHVIDIHSHILYGLDDGAADEDESLAMARQAVQEGIEILVATPHRNVHYPNDGTQVTRSVRTFQKILNNHDIPLQVEAGMEPRIYGDIQSDIADGHVLTLAGTKTVFIEFPVQEVPDYTEQLFYQMQLEGYTPLIVHPERNEVFRENSERLYQLVKKGALTQVTAGSITGLFGNTVKKFSHQLIEAELCHVIASDSHGVKKRPFCMQDAFEQIKVRHGLNTAERLQYNAEALLYGDVLDIGPPAHVKKGFLANLFHR